MSFKKPTVLLNTDIQKYMDMQVNTNMYKLTISKKRLTSPYKMSHYYYNNDAKLKEEAINNLPHYTTKKDWKRISKFVAQFNSEKLNPKLYNWKEASWAIAKYCPQLLHPSNIYFINIQKRFPEVKGMTFKELKKYFLKKHI